MAKSIKAEGVIRGLGTMLMGLPTQAITRERGGESLEALGVRRL